MTIFKKHILLFIYFPIILFLSGLIGIISIGQSMALSPVIVGSDIGLSVSPPDATVFNITNIYPGKTEQSQIIVKNEGSSPFDLHLSVTSSGDQALIDVLYLKISDSVRVHYDGLMAGTHTIHLGEIGVSETRPLNIAVSLVAEAGNETQRKSFDTSWTFRAVSQGAVPPPMFPGAPYIPINGSSNKESDNEVPEDQVVLISPKEPLVQPEESMVLPEEPLVQPEERPESEIKDKDDLSVKFATETPRTGTHNNGWIIQFLKFLIIFGLITGLFVLISLPNNFSKS